jgi:hypothetical protein
LLQCKSFNFENKKLKKFNKRFYSSFDDDLLLNNEKKKEYLQKYNFKMNSLLDNYKDRRNLFKIKKQICEKSLVETQKDEDDDVFLTNIDTTLSIKKTKKISTNSTSTETQLSEDDSNPQNIRLRNAKTSSSLRVKLLYKKALKKALEYHDKIEYTLDLVSKSKISDLPIKSILHKM